jgi:Protein tyrosine phosphatase-like protein, PTPLA
LAALLPQTFGRTFFGFFTLPLAESGSPFVFACLLMFCVVESFRYSFYLLKQHNLDNSFIGRICGMIRYNSFIVCYPIGALGECLVLYYTAKMIQKNHPDEYAIRMPNSLNFSFDMAWAMYAMLPLYGAVFPQIYIYLLGQRKHYM